MKFALAILSRTILVTSTLCLTTQVLAENYGVQVGAYEKVSPQLIKQLSMYGKVVQEPYVGLTRLIISSTGELDGAQSLLRSLQDNGFNDAFIKKIAKHAEVNASYQSEKTHSHFSTTSTPHTHGKDSHRHVESDPKWQQLTPEQRGKAVYLDGKLHLKEGDRFTPID